MKKVGLITIHGIYSFGSVLQAYALQKAVDSLGYYCEVVNYKYPNEYHKEQYRNNNPDAKRNECASIIEIWRMRFFVRLHFSSLYHRIAVKKFNNFISNYLRISPEYPTIESLRNSDGLYDIYLTGSDQVWNPRYLLDDLSFLLSFTESKNKIAFSASFGTTDIPDKYKIKYRPFLSDYRHISTREQSGVSLVHEICSKQSQCTCDPTILMDCAEWQKLVSPKPIIRGKYLLCYILTYTSDPYPYAEKFIEYVSKQLGYKIVCIGNPDRYWLRPGYINLNDCGPLDFLNLFFNASFIISSSFHGSAFSVNLHKDFYSILPPNINDERQESFLKIVGAEDRIVRVDDHLPDSENLHIKDWDMISQRLDSYRKESMSYLENALKDCSDD